MSKEVLQIFELGPLGNILIEGETLINKEDNEYIATIYLIYRKPNGVAISIPIITEEFPFPDQTEKFYEQVQDTIGESIRKQFGPC